MAKNVESLQLDTNNLLSFILTVSGVAVADLPAATRVDIKIGSSILITRNSSINGVDFSQGGGKIVINPGNLTEDLSTLKNQEYRVQVRVFSMVNTDGVVYGGIDDTDSLYFSVTRPLV